MATSPMPSGVTTALLGSEPTAPRNSDGQRPEGRETPASEAREAPEPDGRSPLGSSAVSRQSSVAHDLAYLIPAFALSLASLVLLLTLLVVGLGTLIIGIGVAIVAVCLLMSSSFAAENRRLLANWEGHPRPTPHYDSLDSGPGRLLRTLRDRRLWLELLHGAVVALPVRLVIFAVSISWLAAGFGGITYVVWGWFLPPNSGIATVLSSLAGIELPVSAYLASSVLNFVAGAILLLIAPFVIRLLTRLDAALARIFLTHPVPQPRPLQDPTAPNPTNP